MTADGSECAENGNSTDCLLRALLHLLREHRQADDAEYNWDPITFVVTLLLGILAAFFAVATVLQAILVAGKGRRKTGARAIGKWSQKTTRRWDWSEMNFESTAWTPVLRQSTLEAWIETSTADPTTDADAVSLVNRQPAGYLHNILNGRPDTVATQQGDRPAAPHKAPPHVFYRIWAFFVHGETWRCDFRKTWKFNLRRLPLDYLFPWLLPKHWQSAGYHEAAAHAGTGDASAATWLGFFEKTGLEHLKVPEELDNLRPVAADYLPDDLIAAPAYGQVGVIVIAAVVAGAESWNIIEPSRYPTIIGPNFHFEFRQHPILGLVGAYARYGTTTREPVSPTLDQLKTALDHFKGIGIVRFTNAEWETPDDYDTSISKLVQRSLLANTSSYFNTSNSFFADSDLSSIDNNSTNLSLFIASIPRDIPVAFPSQRLHRYAPPTIVALSGRFWANTPSPELSDNLANSFGEAIAHMECPKWDVFDWDDPQPAYGSRAHHARKGSPKVLLMCTALLHNPEMLRNWFFKLPRYERRKLRRLTFYQLIGVKSWLYRKGKEDVHSRTTLLLNTTWILLKAERKAQMGLFNNAHVDSDSTLNSPNSQQPDQRTIRHHYSNLLQSIRSLVDDLNLDERTLKASLRVQPRAINTRNMHRYLALDGLRAYLEHIPASAQTDTEASISTDDLSFPESLDRKIRKYDDLLRSLSMAGHRDIGEFFNTHRLLDRLGEIVVYHSEPENNWPAWNRFNKHKFDDRTRDLDDVIIYRCLLVSLLFHTAPDIGNSWKSDVWNHIVPII